MTEPTPTDPKPTVAPLNQTAWIPIIGTLIWLGPMWGLVVVGNAIALWAVARWGSMDQSLWMQAAAGWQRWPIAASGFMIVAVFLPMFVTNGATRRRLAQSAFVAMATIVVAATALITLGFFVEGFVFDDQGWAHAVSDQTGRLVDDVGLPAIAAGFLLGLAAWFIGGWILAVGLYGYGWWGFVPFVLLALAPVAIVEFLVLNAMDATQFDFLDAVDVPSLWIGIPASIAALAVAAYAAARGTRNLAVE